MGYWITWHEYHTLSNMQTTWFTWFQVHKHCSFWEEEPFVALNIQWKSENAGKENRDTPIHPNTHRIFNSVVRSTRVCTGNKPPKWGLEPGPSNMSDMSNVLSMLKVKKWQVQYRWRRGKNSSAAYSQVLAPNMINCAGSSPYRVPWWTKYAHMTDNQNFVKLTSDSQAEPFKFYYRMLSNKGNAENLQLFKLLSMLQIPLIFIKAPCNFLL